MDMKFDVDTEYLVSNNNNGLNEINPFQITNDNLVNDFLNNNISLESLIENEIYIH